MPDESFRAYLGEESPEGELGSVEHLGGRDYAGSRDVSLFESTLPLSGGQPREGDPEPLFDLLALVHPPVEGQAGEVVKPGGGAEPVPEVVFVDDAEAEPEAVGAPEDPVVGDAGHVRLDRTVAGEGSNLRAQQGQCRLGHGEVDVGSVSGCLSAVQRGEHHDGGVEAGRQI